MLPSVYDLSAVSKFTNGFTRAAPFPNCLRPAGASSAHLGRSIRLNSCLPVHSS